MTQPTLASYFKSKGQSVRKMDDIHKRRSLSLTANIKSPKTPKNEIYEISDDEESISSNTTVPYTPKSPSPSKSLGTPLTCSTIISSGGSPSARTPKRTYYSPTKKKALALKSPKKVKRNLDFTVETPDIKDFFELCQEYNDTTIFLLNTIYFFLKTEVLHPLMEQESVNLLKSVFQVKKPGMQLVCRLYWRQEGWRRLDTLQKILKTRIENSFLNEVLESLIECGFFTAFKDEQNTDFDTLVNMLKLNELKLVCKDFKVKNIKNKEEMIRGLKSFIEQKTNITKYFNVAKSSNEDRVINALQKKIGACYKLSDLARRTLKELHILMYLGMHDMSLLEKGLELTLINEKTQKETFPIDKCVKLDNASVVFNNREEFCLYLTAYEIYTSFLEETNVSMKCFTVNNVYGIYKSISKARMLSYLTLPEWLHRFTPPYIYIKILEEGIKDLKKDKIESNINLAVEILSSLIEQTYLRQYKKAEWYAEKALILDRLMNEPEQAALLLLEGFRSKLGEHKADILRPRALLLANRQTNPISAVSRAQLLEYATKNDILEKNIDARHFYKQPMENITKGKIVFKMRTSCGYEMLSAEECCRSLYIDQDLYTDGCHWEGKIVTTIFFLLFWEIIYTKLRGVRGIFLSHYQVYPMDMFSESFYTNRKSLIDERLREIELMSTDEMLADMKFVWDGRPECELSGISRSSVGWEQISCVCRCLRATRVAALCRRLATAYHYAHSGFPDLTLWNEDTGEVAFVEVKTDSDKPSLKQIQWMHYMKQHDIHTEFCYIGVNTARAKSRNTGRED